MSVFWVIGAVLFLALAQYILYSRMGMRHVGYSRTFSKSYVYEGDALEMVEVVSNLKLLPLPWLRVEARMPGSLVFDKTQEGLEVVDDLYHTSLFALGPYKRITRTHSVTAARRGYYTMPTASLSLGDGLGLTAKSKTQEMDLRLAVYPGLLDFSVLDVDSHRWQGDTLMRRFIEPDPFLINGIRPWRLGDSIRDVHWGATARTGELQVKSRDYTASPKLYLLLNIQTAEDQWGERLDERQAEEMEYAVRLAATYTTWALNQHIDFAFVCNGRYGLMDDTPVNIPFGRGEPHYHSVMEALAKVRFARRIGFPALMDELPKAALQGVDMVILSPYWSDFMQERAGDIRRRGNAVRWVNTGGGNG